MSVARVVEINVMSTESFDDAIRQGVERASETLRKVKSAWVKDQTVKVKNGRVTAYQVKLMVTFVLDE